MFARGFLATLLIAWIAAPCVARTAGGHTIPTSTNFCGDDQVVIPVTVCNTNDPGTGMKWFNLDLHSGSYPGCDDTFEPSYTQNPLAWGLHPGDCATFQVTLDRPSVLDAVQVACFWAAIDEEDGPAVWLGAEVVDINNFAACVDFSFYEAEWARFIHPLDPVSQGVQLINGGNEYMDFEYEFFVRNAQGETDTEAISLNGQEPGTPYSSYEVLEPRQEAFVGVEFMLMKDDQPGPFELVMMMDSNFDGEMEEAGSVPLHNDIFFHEGGEPINAPVAAPAARTGATLEMDVAPNPFNPATVVSFRLEEDAVVSADIVDLQGRIVARLLEGEHLGAGEYQRRWNGKDEQGGGVASGVYYLHIRAGERQAMRKITLLK